MGDNIEQHNEERSPIAPYHLNNVEWSLSLQMAQSGFNKILDPSGTVHFDLVSTGLNKDVSHTKHNL